MWGLARFALVFMVVVPLFVGLATVVVPMQIGSSNIAFPRAALASAWGYVFGSLIVIISVFAGGGWGALDAVTTGEADAIQLTLLGTGLLLGSLLLASVCLATTVISLRTAGMGLMKAPLFAWSILVASSVWLLTLPVAIANLIIVTVDLRGGPLVFGDPQSSSIYEQLAWVFEQPQIYAIAIPALGVLGSVIPVSAESRHFNHAAMVIVIGLAGLLSIGGWSQPFFGDTRSYLVYVAFGLAAGLPVFGALALYGLTLFKGQRPVGIPTAHFAGSLIAVLLLLGAVSVGGLRVIEPLELIGTTADTAVMNFTAFAALTAALAGLAFWSSKIFSSPANPFLGLVGVLSFAGAASLLGLSGLIAGFDGAPDNLLGDVSHLAETMSIVSVLGALAGFGGATALFGLVSLSLMSTSVDEADPWGGHTLEWATATPVATDNFDGPIARVKSEAPLLDGAAEESEAS